jgi:phage terminase large subunit-like protein
MPTSRRPGPRRQPQAAKDQSTERIDGIVALIMAMGRAMVAKEQVPATPMAL